MANGWIGWKIAEWLHGQEENIVGLVIHPPETAKYEGRIFGETSPDVPYRYATQLHDVDYFRSLAPDIIVSAAFGYILKPEIIDIPPLGCINLHTGLLPYNRGLWGNIYPFLDGTPAGVTIHYIDEGIDTGDVIAQREVSVLPLDTGGTLYWRLADELVELFKETWPVIKAGTAPRVPQNKQSGTLHLRSDLAGIEEIDLDKMYSARDLINLLRGLTFSPHPPAYYIERGKKIYVQVRLFDE